MGFKSQIILDKTIIFPGETLTGKLVYYFNTDYTVKVTILEIVGKAHIRYKKDDDYSNVHETFLKDEIVVIDKEINVKPGKYEYPFKYVMPLKSPSSYNYRDLRHISTVNSQIKYSIHTKQTIPFRTHGYSKERFIVMRHIDLNAYPEAKEPAELNMSKNKFWIMFRKRPLFVCIRLPTKFFQPGSSIPFYIECNNRSSYQAKNVTAYLNLFITYKAIHSFKKNKTYKIPISESEVTLSEFNFGPVNIHEGKVWNDTLEIPKIFPIQSEGCKILELKYYFHVKVRFPIPHRILEGKIPIVLGSTLFNGSTDVSLLINHNKDEASSSKQNPFVGIDENKIMVIPDLKYINHYKIKKTMAINGM